MLAVGLSLFCLRYLIPTAYWSDRAAKFSFWSLNIGLAWMSFGTLFPLGIIQLYRAVSAGYFEARSMKFLTSGLNATIEWIRLPGDLIFIIGIVPILYICWHGIRHRLPHRPTEGGTTVLFTERTPSPQAGN